MGEDECSSDASDDEVALLEQQGGRHEEQAQHPHHLRMDMLTWAWALAWAC